MPPNPFIAQFPFSKLGCRPFATHQMASIIDALLFFGIAQLRLPRLFAEVLAGVSALKGVDGD